MNQKIFRITAYVIHPKTRYCVPVLDLVPRDKDPIRGDSVSRIIIIEVDE
jgi:hypothetical protein